VAFTQSTITINNGQIVYSAPDSYVYLDSTANTCLAAAFSGGQWSIDAPTPGSGNTLLSAAAVPCPSGVPQGPLPVSWCGGAQGCVGG
jgi:hypothetical protein